jgi:hypothetical protein
MTRDPVDLYAKENRSQGMSLFAMGRRDVRRLPPHRPSLEHFLSDFSFSQAVWTVRQLFIAAKGNHAHPFLGTLHYVGLDAHQWVCAHPINLLAHCREAVDMVGPVGKIKRDNVRLVLMRACQPPKASANQHLEALWFGHFLNKHWPLFLFRLRGKPSSDYFDRASGMDYNRL